MGCAKSKPASDAPINAVDAKLIEAVKQTKRRRGSQRRRSHTFDELFMKFPKLRAGFLKCRDYFDQIDTNKDGFIDPIEFKDNCAKIGLDPNSATLTSIFEAADVDRSKKLDKIEFIIVFTIIQLTEPEKATQIHPDIQAALDIIEQAFCYFDSSADGYLERAEVAAALTKGKKKAQDNHGVSDLLFDQLDWDGNGRVSFKEFLIGIEKLVLGIDEDEEDSKTV